MPDPLSSWLSAVKSRLAGTKPETWIRESHHWGKENAAFIASAPSDLALAVRLIEAVEIACSDEKVGSQSFSDSQERAYRLGRDDAARMICAALHSAFEAEKS